MIVWCWGHRWCLPKVTKQSGIRQLMTTHTDASEHTEWLSLRQTGHGDRTQALSPFALPLAVYSDDIKLVNFRSQIRDDVLRSWLKTFLFQFTVLCCDCNTAGKQLVLPYKWFSWIGSKVVLKHCLAPTACLVLRVVFFIRLMPCCFPLLLYGFSQIATEYIYSWLIYLFDWTIHTSICHWN